MALDPRSKEAKLIEKYRQKAEAAKQKELAKAEAAKQKELAKAEAAAKAEASKAQAAQVKENNKAVLSASKAQNKLSALALQLATALKDKFAKHVPEFIVDPAVAASSELEKVSISANATCWPSHYTHRCIFPARFYRRNAGKTWLCVSTPGRFASLKR